MIPRETATTAAGAVPPSFIVVYYIPTPTTRTSTRSSVSIDACSMEGWIVIMITAVVVVMAVTVVVVTAAFVVVFTIQHRSQIPIRQCHRSIPTKIQPGIVGVVARPGTFVASPSASPCLAAVTFGFVKIFFHDSTYN